MYFPASKGDHSRIHYIIKPSPSPPSGADHIKMGNLNKPTTSPGFQAIMSPIYAYFL